MYRSPFFAMRSRAGVGTTPPNVPGAPKPTSSVMMSSTLGAPFGGTMRGAHQGFDSEAFSLITPPNFGSGGGSCFPSMVVVAYGEPGTPVVCWAEAGAAASMAARTTATITDTNGSCLHIFPLDLKFLRYCARLASRGMLSSNFFLSQYRHVATVKPTSSPVLRFFKSKKHYAQMYQRIALDERSNWNSPVRNSS